MLSISGSDLILASVTFGFIATLIWAKGFVIKDVDATLEETATYLGHNPFLIKTTMIEQVMVIISIVSAAICATLAIVGTYMNVRKFGSNSFFMSSNKHLVSYFILSIIFVFIVCKVANLIARARYIPILREKMREAYEISIFIFQNDGLEKRHFDNHLDLPRTQRDENLKVARDRFKRLALLFGIKLKRKDDYGALIDCLKKQFK